MVVTFETETVIFQAKVQSLADYKQEKHVKNDGEVVIAVLPRTQRKVPQPRTPSRYQQDNQKNETRRQVGKAKPALDLVIAAGFRCIGRIGRCVHEAALPWSLAARENA